jgi:hypothetical protein
VSRPATSSSSRSTEPLRARGGRGEQSRTRIAPEGLATRERERYTRKPTPVAHPAELGRPSLTRPATEPAPGRGCGGRPGVRSPVQRLNRLWAGSRRPSRGAVGANSGHWPGLNGWFTRSTGSEGSKASDGVAGQLRGERGQLGGRNGDGSARLDGSSRPGVSGPRAAGRACEPSGRGACGPRPRRHRRGCAAGS